jgi:hypothetical protein
MLTKFLDGAKRKGLLLKNAWIIKEDKMNVSQTI